MSTNEELANAIETAVSESGQQRSVAKRLIAWVSEMSARDSLNKEEHGRHLRNVFDAMEIEQENGNAD